MLPQHSLPLETGDTNICPLEPSNYLSLSTPDHSTSCDLNHSVSLSASSGHNTGRRPRRNKTNHSRVTLASKPGDGGILGNLHGSQRRLLHARKTPSEKFVEQCSIATIVLCPRVIKTFKLSFRSMLEGMNAAVLLSPYVTQGGANRASFKCQCVALIKTHKPTVLVLLETKMVDHKNLAEIFKFDSHLEFSVDGKRGGIVVMWKEDLVKLHNFFISPQEVHTTIKERLDRCMANTSWIKCFPEVIITHLPRTKFDHCPLLLTLTPNNQGSNPKPFRFEPMWCNHHTFQDLVHENFSPDISLFQAINSFQRNATLWNHTVFGNLFKKLRTISARLDGLQKSNHYHSSTFLHKLENDPLYEYEALLKCEEDFWKIKSKISWLIDGDANTAFFHASTLQRRRKNKITELVDDVGQVVRGEEPLTNLIMHHFTKLFTTSQNQSANIHLSPIHANNVIQAEAYQILDTPLRDSEIHLAVKGFKPLKAPGPNGLHPLFYQKFWNEVGPKVISFYRNIFSTSEIPNTHNTTLLCLIPKCRNASNLRNYRPIGLCNTSYKIITNIIVNKIKPILQDIISPSQASFLLNRRAADQAIIIQEYITHFAKMKGK
ncbi:hypothetical protein FXO38_07989 [Capsicum annuum]|nr:hypothetical protein FXO38_07989 [Capsicum annuum]